MEVVDPSYSHIIIGFDAVDQVRYIPKVAREDGDARCRRYRAVGDLEQARRLGDPSIRNFAYEWKVGAEGHYREALVILHRRDPEFFSTHSLKRIGAASASE